jgi:hypothetical protein
MRWFILGCAVLLSACTAVTDHYASDEVIKNSAYVHDGPPVLALYTMVNNRHGAGEHSALLVNGSQRVVFDPAGTLVHDDLIEKDDVLYGMTPPILDFYTRAHARKSFHVVIQEIEVSPETAELAFSLVRANGPVTSAFCASATSNILRQIPGFESIPQTMRPNKLREAFGKLPGVTEQALYEYDDDDKRVALRAFDAALVAAQK